MEQEENQKRAVCDGQEEAIVRVTFFSPIAQISLLHFPNEHSGWSQADVKPEARSFLQISQGAQATEQLPLLSQVC